MNGHRLSWSIIDSEGYKHALKREAVGNYPTFNASLVISNHSLWVEFLFQLVHHVWKEYRSRHKWRLLHFEPPSGGFLLSLLEGNMIKTTCLGCGKETKDCVCHSPDNWENTAPWDETVTSDNELIEQLKAIRNRCDAVMWLLENPNAFYVVHTLLEDIYENAQIIVEDFCIEDEE